MSEAVIIIYINITSFVLISYLIGQNNVGQNFSLGKIFVNIGKFRHFCQTKNFGRRKILSIFDFPYFV